MLRRTAVGTESWSHRIFERMTETPKKVFNLDMIDALLPPEMALACETAGVAKARRDAPALIVLGVLIW